MAKKIRFQKSKEKDLGLNKDGSEKLSSKPTELRANLNNPVSLRQKMKNLWMEFNQKQSDFAEQESLADSQDFDVENDVFGSSPYEVEGDLMDAVANSQEFVAHEAVAEEKKEVNNEVSSEESNQNDL